MISVRRRRRGILELSVRYDDPADQVNPFLFTLPENRVESVYSVSGLSKCEISWDVVSLAPGGTTGPQQPVQDGSVISWYNRSEFFNPPFAFHGGVDVGGARGSSVNAVYGGDVEGNQWLTGYGWVVSVHMTEGPYSGQNMRYAHLDAQSALTVGAHVNAGGNVGSLGNTGGPPNMEYHVHMDVGQGVWTPRANRINIDAIFRDLYP